MNRSFMCIVCLLASIPSCTAKQAATDGSTSSSAQAGTAPASASSQTKEPAKKDWASNELALSAFKNMPPGEIKTFRVNVALTTDPMCNVYGDATKVFATYMRTTGGNGYGCVLREHDFSAALFTTLQDGKQHRSTLKLRRSTKNDVVFEVVGVEPNTQ